MKMISAFAVGLFFCLSGCAIDEEVVTQDSMAMCTMDAKQCPDGSWVSRVPPKCKFATCPENE